MASQLKFDEINELIALQYYEEKEYVWEVVYDFLIEAYMKGREDVEDEMDYYLDMELGLDKLDESVNKVVGGKTTEQRIEEYLEQENGLMHIQEVVDNEYHRIYNDGAYDTAVEIENESGRRVMKTWMTELDDRVRDTHDYLEGMQVPLGERFYTWDGDSALYPNGFEKADNNVNCRCEIKYSFE